MPADRSAGARLVYLDNLKWVLIAGVIVSHAATAYGAIGGWLYVEPTLNPLTKSAFSVLTEIGDMFALGTFMLVAGLLTPRALGRKGFGRFVRDRLLRLGVPFVATVVVVTPLLVWLIVAVTGYPLTLGEYVQYQLRWLDPGPMWFVGVLLLFTLCYVVWRQVRPATRSDGEPLRMRHLLVAASLIAALSFLVRLVFPVGSIQPLQAQIWHWPQLAVLFAFGVLAGERGWLVARPAALIRRVCWVAVPAALVVLFSTVVATGADLSSGSSLALYAGGWHWQSVITSGVEGVVAVAASLALIDLFRQVGTWHGPLASALGLDSYSAYFLQLPVLVALELALRVFGWPGRGFGWPGEVKLALSAPAAIAVCFALAWAIRRAFDAVKTWRWKTTGSQPSLRRGVPHRPVG